ncbi:LLM class flavin-dependent oxidoreductase [Streptomyces sp. MI02-7b]|uniref:LLM class flavin-dependent oxidoreductase n=1 Tax=Streptomyces sp. MI02-7b TaxID=462941 RepID=UPI0029AF3B3B|nr:LLM class flavin-dependent oxidoreductase [Streptomyces sp. MI02-7b]MDX3071006.1 LLM class flavin-dependent oxidoreductase [Streptomyces sp. MI02-7b]
MKIGIGLPNHVRDVPPDLVPAWAARAEQAGFASLGSVGRISYPGVMDTVALAAAAGATGTIELISTILIGPVWPPDLLAKEVAGIDGVSGGRFTLGLGLGGRLDDFLAEGPGAHGRAARMERDIEEYRRIWRGGTPPGAANPLVPAGTRGDIPVLLGGLTPKAYRRAALIADGFIGASMAPAVVAPPFEAVRKAWREAGRAGSPRLVALAYFVLGDPEAGRAHVRDYYRSGGEEMASAITAGVSCGADAVRAAVRAFADIGADELVLNPTVADPDEIARLADSVL